MTIQPDNLPLPERFDHLFALISSDRFLNKQGLGNEIPFFICPYSPKEAVEMADLAQQLTRKLATHGVEVLNINLYDLAIELLRARGIWEHILEIEPTVSKDRLKELLQNVLDPETHMVPAIAEKMAARPYDVIFITGVGEVFPYIRSHNILNNLQSTAKEQPTVMFFPGTYERPPEMGASLVLFGRLHDDNYYRAFNIYHIGI